MECVLCYRDAVVMCSCCGCCWYELIVVVVVLGSAGAGSVGVWSSVGGVRERGRGLKGF
jgi:hypothetical protein